MDKLLIYGGVSTALTAAVISNALNARSNFYAAAVQIGRSSGAIMVSCGRECRDDKCEG
jgi:E3 ubiquitin-protein ligase synoviolin